MLPEGDRDYQGRSEGFWLSGTNARRHTCSGPRDC
jgi:hypothetical protein